LLLDKTKFPASLAGDVSAEKAAFMADSQVPWGVNALGGEPSSRPPLLGAGPLRTGRDGFPSSGSGPLNASFGETRW